MTLQWAFNNIFRVFQYVRVELAEGIYWGRRAKRSCLLSQTALKSVKWIWLLYWSSMTPNDFLRGTCWTTWQYTQRRTGFQIVRNLWPI